MIFQNPGQHNDLSNHYGYRSGRRWDLDRTAAAWATKSSQGWGRLFELKLDKTQRKPQPVKAEEAPLDQEAADYFTKVSRIGFQHIARRHHLTPSQMWNKVSKGLQVMGMHHDDLDDVQELMFGWKDLSVEMLERFRWRYPDRCPLLDVLCTMDETCPELNELQDWILEIKGSKDRRRLELLPALPSPDGVRQPPKKRVSISFTELLYSDDDDRNRGCSYCV
jgi:hypothetical protein